MSKLSRKPAKKLQKKLKDTASQTSGKSAELTASEKDKTTVKDSEKTETSQTSEKLAEQTASETETSPKSKIPNIEDLMKDNMNKKEEEEVVLEQTTSPIKDLLDEPAPVKSDYVSKEDYTTYDTYKKYDQSTEHAEIKEQQFEPPSSQPHDFDYVISKDKKKQTTTY